ncbi:Imm70 family immunity protein [Streptomyces sp. MS2A]|nr:Imm70 family immunity protein [Streptomyces sp. MS2A]
MIGQRYVWLGVGETGYPIRRADYLASFFDTVAFRLEGGARGSLFPTVAWLYEHGHLGPSAATHARTELRHIFDALRALPPTDVVWTIDDPTRPPPWDEYPTYPAETLADWHSTADGHHLMTVVDTALETSIRTGHPLRIV